MSTGDIGAVGELKTVVDLMSRGFEVFRAVSPAASCDLIALKEGKSVRVEVRTGRRGRDRVLCNRRGNYDILAVVLPDGNIHYEPLLNSA